MSMVNIDEFLNLVGLYRKHTGLAESTVSHRLFNDGKRIEMLRDGRDVGIRKVEDAVQFLSDNWPDAVVWPKKIERPKTSAAS